MKVASCIILALMLAITTARKTFLVKEQKTL